MRKHYLIFSLVLLAASCMSTIQKSGQSYVNPSYTNFKSDVIGVMYFTHPQTNISNMATYEAEQALKECRNIVVRPAAETEEYLQKAGLYTIPQHITKVFIDSLGKVLPYKYLLKGTVNQWENPVFEGQTEGPKVNVTLEIYDLKKGIVAWSFSGGESSIGYGDDSTWFRRAHTASTQMGKLIRRAFKTWPSLCVKY